MEMQIHRTASENERLKKELIFVKKENERFLTQDVNTENVRLRDKNNQLKEQLEESRESSEKLYNDFIKEMLKLKSSVRGQISEITYAKSEYDNSRFLLYMDDGNHVYVNIAKFSKLNYYDEIYPTLNNKKGTLYLDSGNHFEVF